jgi:predicted Fe-Mo cluster-binding NifX family protein
MTLFKWNKPKNCVCADLKNKGVRVCKAARLTAEKVLPELIRLNLCNEENPEIVFICA